MSPIFSNIGPVVITEKMHPMRPVRSQLFRNLGSSISFYGKPGTKISAPLNQGLIQPI